MNERQEIEAIPTWKRVLRVCVSALFGGILYSAWLTIFLLASRESRFLETALWLLAPIAAALGFLVGMALFDRVARIDEPSYLKAFPWPLAGCILGAVVVFWFGPMLIVFSMLGLGTLSVAAREVYLARPVGG